MIPAPRVYESHGSEPVIVAPLDPTAALEYDIDLRGGEKPYLEDGESIATHTVTVDPPDELAITSTAVVGDKIVAYLDAAAAVAGTVYTLAYSWTTTAIPVRRDKRSLSVTVAER